MDYKIQITKLYGLQPMSINSFESYFMSWLPDRKSITRPCYLSLANLLEGDIRSGKLAPGTRLPPQRELADYLGLNFTTVTRAYDLCRERHLIYGVTGRGSFVSSLPGHVPEKRQGLIELGLVNGFDFIRKPVIEATRNILGKGYLEELYTYSDPAGHLHQREAGVRWMAQMNIRTDSSRTAIFSGAQNVISAAMLSLFRVGDRIAVDEFTYANLIGTAHLTHTLLLPVRGDAAGMIPSELDKLCRKEKIRGIFLMPNYANPTALTMPETRRDELAEVIRKYRLTLIEDDPGCWMLENLPTPFYARLEDQTVYICGSTMSLCSGLRVTFATFPESYREKLLQGAHHLNIKTSSLDAEIMTELITSGKATQILREKRVLAGKANHIYNTIFPDQESDRTGLFRCLPLPLTKLSADGIRTEQFFAEQGVSVQHAHRFSVRKHPGKAFLRLSICSAGTGEALTDGLCRVKNALPRL